MPVHICFPSANISFLFLEPSPRPNRLVPNAASKAPTSPKPPPPPASYRRSVLVNSAEQEPALINSDSHRNYRREVPMEDEGDQIEHEILDIVEQEELKEQHRNTPPAVPEKKRPVFGGTPDNNLNLEVDSTNKLVHPGKFRARPARRQPRARRGTNGGTHDSSSDGGLDDDDIPMELPPTEIATSDPPTNELPPKYVDLFDDASIFLLICLEWRQKLANPF